MNRVDLKRRILGNRALVRIPWLARELLLSPEPGRAFARPAVDAAAQDPTLATYLRDEAQAAPEAPLDATLAARLDAPALRRATLRAWAVESARVKGHVLDHRAYWSTALRTAKLADQIAAHAQLTHAHLAFATGLLCNLGRPALDLALEDGYQHRLEGPTADGLPLLDSEQQSYGADHTQAGKWLAEHWRLPHPVVNAIWLHHLPVEALDEVDESAGLAAVAALAAMLTLVHTPSRISAPILARAEHLGLHTADLERLLEDTPEPPLDVAPVSGAPDSVRSVTPPGMQQQLAYWESLAEVLQVVRPPMPFEDALAHIAQGVQRAFGLAPGIAYAVDADAKVSACRWRSTTEAASVVRLQSTETASPLAALIARLTSASGGAGLVCAPFLSDGAVLGQLVFEADALSAHGRDAALADVQRFAAACGHALKRCDDHERLSAGHEKMASALQRLEHAHRQSLRNARLDSAAMLASGAAHQLNNPLAIISGRAQLLLNRTEDVEQVRGLETILRESRRTARILTELMQFARPGEPKFAEADAAGLLRNTAAGMHEELGKHLIQVIEDMAAPLPRVPIDASQLELVFSHVIRNAMQAMREGGKIYLRARPSSDARSLVLQVEDTGSGIRPEALDHVFEPFFTASDDAEPHTGLGLAVCRAVLDRHQGTITLHNNPNGGCTCTITLSSAERRRDLEIEPVLAPPPRFDAAAFAPRRGQPESPKPARAAFAVPSRQNTPPHVPTDAKRAALPEAPPTPTGESKAPPKAEPAPEHREGAKRIIFADRDDDLREVLGEALRSRGYDVVTVSDGLEAHAAVLTGKVDLVIAELALPALSGRDLLEQVRSRVPGLPFIVLAGAATPDDDMEILDTLGASLCLRKPFGLESLLQDMERLLDTSPLAKGA